MANTTKIRINRGNKQGSIATSSENREFNAPQSPSIPPNAPPTSERPGGNTGNGFTGIAADDREFDNESDSAIPEVNERRGRGRPKGSKNKPKESVGFVQEEKISQSGINKRGRPKKDRGVYLYK
jgi:hypothetical protein